MHYSQFWFITIVSFLLMVGRSFLPNTMTFWVCGAFSSNALSCAANGSSANRANAAQTIRPVRELEWDPPGGDLPPQFPNESIEKIGDIPRLRHPEVQLPNDFRILHQMPMRSGNREILLVSPSTGTEQRYLISLQDNETFELFQAEFSQVTGIDWRLFAGRGNFNIDPKQIQQHLSNFEISFIDNAVTTLHLAEGSTAEFTAEQAIIRSPDGQELDTISLLQTELSIIDPAIGYIPTAKILVTPPVPRSLVFDGAGANRYPYLARSLTVESLRPYLNPVYWHTGDFVSRENSPFDPGQRFLAQSEPDCQQTVVASFYTGATQLDTWAKRLISSQNETTKLAGWALKFGARALKDNISPGAAHVQDSICKPPVQCDEEKVSGGSEVRTNLLQLPADIDRSQVSLQYNFFEIPDRLEFYYDGEQIFAIGPASGEDTQTLPIPDAANQIGIALTGSQDPKTKWWYKISCSQEEGNGEQGTGNGERKRGDRE